MTFDVIIRHGTVVNHAGRTACDIGVIAGRIAAIGNLGSVGWTPFADMAVTGWPIATIVRGAIVMRDDQLISTAIGQPCRFVECL